MVNIDIFIKDLKTSKVFTAKQCVVIESIYIYFTNLKVYKVIVAVNPSMLKKAKKLGLSSQYTTTFFDDILISIPNIQNIEKGNFIMLYNPNTNQYEIFPGEVSEEEQMRNLKRPNF